MALLRRGEDPNAPDEARVDAAVDDLVALAEGVDVEVSAEGAYHELQTGEYAFQQSWSGDLLSAKRDSGASQPTMPTVSRSPGRAAASSAAT